MTQNASRVISGTYGRVWVNGELWAEVDEFEAKVTVTYEDINFANEGGTRRKATGWNGEGRMVIKKIYSRVQRAMAANVRKGIYPRFEIVGKVADPDAFGAERAALHDVTISEFNLLRFANKTLGSEEIPFAFGDYEIIDMI
ncbi:phage tail tube protein [Paenibacillus validus]|uniref:phage tail tube protein n=1 Tax=Paenibacillus validus TaxID=44253 RepID=UPI000FD8B9B4|nr:phage tail tube protein [Paenibacillus validus]MED4599870.1 phage tail tube protein [Paenibacillus validus]MED4606097.1 phage tail tube protein [Paenibacillus validus]